MKKNDWILAGAVLAAALIVYLVSSFVVHKDGAVVVVTVEGEGFGT